MFELICVLTAIPGGLQRISMVHHASVKFGIGIAQISGSIGGTVFARNRGGAYIRNRTTPVNPQTDRQSAVRQSVAFLANEWSQTLTAAERTAWGLYADSVAMTNRLGETVYLSGYNHYIRSNSLLKRSAHDLMESGPTVFELPEHDPLFEITADESAQEISVVFDDTAEWCDESSAHAYIFQGSPQNAQRNFFDGPWRILGSIDGSATSGIASPQTFAVEFAVNEGQRQWCYARIQRGDGRLSEPFRDDSFVVA